MGPSGLSTTQTSYHLTPEDPLGPIDIDGTANLALLQVSYFIPSSAWFLFFFFFGFYMTSSSATSSSSTFFFSFLLLLLLLLLLHHVFSFCTEKPWAESYFSGDFLLVRVAQRGLAGGGTLPMGDSGKRTSTRRRDGRATEGRQGNARRRLRSASLDGSLLFVDENPNANILLCVVCRRGSTLL
jgi:hypothetical protein